MLRLVVILASSAQMSFGAVAAWRMVHEQPPDVFGVVLCTAVVIAGLTGLVGLAARTRPSPSRRATVKLHGLLVVLVVVAAIVVLLVEHREGVSAARLAWLAALFGMLGAPFVLNAGALVVIERRSRRLAATA